MKHRRVLSLVILAGFLMACNGSLQAQSYLQQYGSQGGRGQGFRMYPYRVSHELHACVTEKIRGRISRLRVETFSSDMEPGLGVDVQTLDLGLVHVHLGPLWFLDRQEADLKPGDEVTIRVMCYTLAGKERLVAGEVAHKDHTLKLRDLQGNPYWEARR